MWPHYDKPVTKESMREIDTVVSSLRTTFTQIKRVYSDVKVVKLSVFYAVWFSVRMMVLIYWQLLFEELIGAKTNALVLGLVSVAGAVAALLPGISFVFLKRISLLLCFFTNFDKKIKNSYQKFGKYFIENIGWMVVSITWHMCSLFVFSNSIS